MSTWAKVALLLLCFTGTAQAIEKENEFWVWQDGNPPGRFLHPYKGKLIEHHVDRAGAWAACGRGFAGCAFPAKGQCTIYYTDAAARSHEIAHCNGWSGDHARTGLDRFHWTLPPPRQ